MCYILSARKHCAAVHWECLGIPTTLLPLSLFSHQAIKSERTYFFFHRSQINLKITILSIFVWIFFFFCLLANFFHISREEFPSNFGGGGCRGGNLHLKYHVLCRIISRKMHSDFLVIMTFHGLLCSLEDTSPFLCLLSLYVGMREIQPSSCFQLGHINSFVDNFCWLSCFLLWIL